MARITIIGGTGYAGALIVAEAASRGHEVTSISRALPDEKIDGVTYVEGSVTDADIRARAVQDADVVYSAISPRGDMEGRTRQALADLAGAAQQAGVRLGITGGAGSLLVAEGGPRLSDTDDFPDAFKTEAAEMAAVLDDLRASDASLDWFYVSPAAGFGAFAPGEKTGAFRVGGDVLLADADGNSFISGADFATAVVDEIEQPAHRRTRFSVAY